MWFTHGCIECHALFPSWTWWSSIWSNLIFLKEYKYIFNGCGPASRWVSETRCHNERVSAISRTSFPNLSRLPIWKAEERATLIINTFLNGRLNHSSVIPVYQSQLSCFWTNYFPISSINWLLNLRNIANWGMKLESLSEGLRLPSKFTERSNCEVPSFQIFIFYSLNWFLVQGLRKFEEPHARIISWRGNVDFISN